MQTDKKLPRLSLCATSVAAGLMFATQYATAQSMALEEIVVTAQKKTESIQQTPISIAAFSAAALEAKGIETLVDLQANVPNFQLSPTPTSSTSVRAFMRGVGNNDDQITQDPSVAIYVDGAYVARSQGLAMEIADIERIEVLRGPQGSLYGRNATGGAINFITSAPDLSGFGFEQSFSFGNRNRFRSNTRVNVPVTEDFAAQLSYLTAQEDGYVENLGTGESRFGDKDRDAWRVDMLWQPGDDIEARYSYDRSNIEDTPAFIAAVPMHPEEGKRPSHGSPAETGLRANDITVQGHTLNVSWELNDHLSLKSITSYRTLEGTTNRKYLTDEVIPGFPISASVNHTDQDQFSQEFHLTGNVLDARLEYIVGAYYFEESADRFDISDRAFQSFRNLRTVTAENKALALFGQATYTPDMLDDRLHVTVGARWSRDDREATLQETAITAGAAAVGPEQRGDDSFSNISPTLVIAYDVSYDVNVYGKVTRGYKTGGYNIRASEGRFGDGFDEESLTAYELGVKSQFWDNRIRFNAAVFYSDYKDIQINTRSDPTNPAVTDVINAGEATISGTELEFTARVTEGLTANLSYAYLRAKYEEVEDAFGVDRAAEYRFINAPRHSYTANLKYEFPVLPIGQLTANVGYNWQDEKRDSSTGPFIIDDYGLLNARLSLSEIPVGPGQLRVAAWGRNLEDKQYYLTHFELGVPAAIFGEPRSYGLDVTYEY